MERWGRQNPRLKELRKLAQSAAERRRSGLFLLEGPRLLQGASLVHLLVAESRLESYPHLLEEHRGVAVTVPDDVLDRLVTVETGQGLLGVARRPVLPNGWWSQHRALLWMRDLQDPGNVGTLLRTALAAGVGGAVVSGVDPFGPKVVRASAGAVLRLDIQEGDPPPGFVIVATTPRGGQDLFSTRLPEKALFLLGNEGRGLASLPADGLRVTIPMEPGSESLNVAVCGALLMYEWRRQRLSAGKQPGLGQTE